MEDLHRLFFALIPPEYIKLNISNFRTILQKTNQLTQISGIKLVPYDNFHLTLSFLGMIHSNSIPEVIEYASKIKSSSFSLTLNTIGYFKRSMVLWIGVKKTPYELEYLIDGLKVNIRHLTDPISIRYPSKFIPHLSIIKKLTNVYDYPNILKQYVNIEWPVDRFYLVRSTMKDNYVSYEILSEFILS